MHIAVTSRPLRGANRCQASRSSRLLRTLCAWDRHISPWWRSCRRLLSWLLGVPLEHLPQPHRLQNSWCVRRRLRRSLHRSWFRVLWMPRERASSTFRLWLGSETSTGYFFALCVRVRLDRFPSKLECIAHTDCRHAHVTVRREDTRKSLTALARFTLRLEKSMPAEVWRQSMLHVEEQEDAGAPTSPAAISFSLL